MHVHNFMYKYKNSMHVCMYVSGRDSVYREDKLNSIISTLGEKQTQKPDQVSKSYPFHLWPPFSSNEVVAHVWPHN